MPRRKTHGGARPGAGRPARADGPTTSFTLRLSGAERDTLSAMAARLKVSESDVLRRLLAEALSAKAGR